MSSEPQDTAFEQSISDVQEIATAPGDLPLSQVEARLRTLETQFRHDNTIEPLAPRPGAPVDITATSGTSTGIVQARLYYTIDGTAPSERSAHLPMEAVSVEWAPLSGYLTTWQGRLPAQPAGTTVRYRIGGWRSPGHGDEEAPELWASDGQGFHFQFSGDHGITAFAYAVEPDGNPIPAWARDAVIYQIFLDRFHPGTPDGRFRDGTRPTERHGGTLDGVMQALPYLSDLGITCLWLSPLFPAETYHRYDATDYYDVDGDLGGADALRALTQAAHERGIRVMLDFVPSHCSWNHPAFREAQRTPTSPKASWFTFDEYPHSYRNFLQATPALPSFNTDDPGARAYLIGSAVHAMQAYGIDAFRLDHAIGPSMDFWVAFRNDTRATDAEVFSVAEATDTPDSLRRFRNRLDAVLDFPLARALRLTFATGAWSLSRFDAFLRDHERYIAIGPGRVSFLDNHDMNRFLFLAQNRTERLKLAALCQFTLEPPPTIYYGTEIGLTQHADIHIAGDSEARRDMPWDAAAWDDDLLTFYRALVGLRRARPVMRDGGRVMAHLESMDQTYAYWRTARDRSDQAGADVLVAFNLGQHTRTIVVTPPASGAYVCLLSTGAVPKVEANGAAMRIVIAGNTGAVIGKI